MLRSAPPVIRAGDALLAACVPIDGWRNLLTEPARLFWISGTESPTPRPPQMILGPDRNGHVASGTGRAARPARPGSDGTRTPGLPVRPPALISACTYSSRSEEHTSEL